MVPQSTVGGIVRPEEVHEAGDDRAVDDVHGPLGVDRNTGCGNLLREPVGAEAAQHNDHRCRNRSLLADFPPQAGGAAVRPTGRCPRSAAWRPRSRRRRFRHQGRSVASRVRLERQVPGSRQRRLGRHRSPTARWRERFARAMRPARPTPATRERTASFALGHPEKLIDYAYRSVHEMTVKAKAIVDRVLRHGADALVLQWLLDRRPAGAHGGAALSRTTSTASSPARRAIRRPHLDAWRIWMAQAMFKDQASFIPAAKYPRHPSGGARRLRCARRVKDGLIENPTRCRFDPGVLACQGARRPGLPDRRAGGSRAGRHEPGEESTHRRA